MAKARAHIVIGGLVQGVFFRASMRREAQKFGVTGWVRNMRDGKVEAVCEGEKAAIEQLISWCHEGPPGAIPEGVSVEWEGFGN